MVSNSVLYYLLFILFYYYMEIRVTVCNREHQSVCGKRITFYHKYVTTWIFGKNRIFMFAHVASKLHHLVKFGLKFAWKMHICCVLYSSKFWTLATAVEKL